MKKSTKFILGVVLAIYLWCLFVFIKTPIITDIARNGVLEDSINVEAYIVKRESLVFSNTAGNIFPIVQEGEKVKKNTKIASVYQGNNNNDIQEKLSEINQRINSINENSVKNSLFSSDLEKLDAKIKQQSNEIIECTYLNNTLELNRIKHNINEVLHKKLLVNGDKGAGKYNLEEIIKLKEKYEEQLNSDKTDLVATNAGIVSYYIDNMEQLLNPDKISEFKPSDFSALSQLDYTINTQVKAGGAAAKIIDNFEWYVSFILEDKDVYDIKMGDEVAIRFNTNQNENINALVYNISNSEKGKVVVSLLVNRNIEISSNIRKTNIDFIKHTYSGFKVPISSVRVKEGKHGVYVAKDRIARFCEVEILYNNNDFAIVRENNLNSTGLLLYDEVVVKGNSIEEGTIVR
jgi:putative membrane fusion protein